ncbi:MAG: toll/interleukin-1 receptor domain-containing protein [Dehalococcoidia bacterium]
MARKVFLSYSSNNAEGVRVLATDIESLGHTVWYDHELSGGQRWWDHILEEIRTCDALVFAVSAPAADSRACLSELRYAEALGKPVLPVTVERDFAESLLPPSLSQLQRVNYTAQDKVAFAALNRSLASLPEAPPPPAELPEAPPVPASYLFDLKTALDEAGQMAAERQEELLAELRGRLRSGHTHADVLALTRRFRQRQDLLLRIDRLLEEFEAELMAASSAAAPALAQTPPPAAPAPAPAASFASADAPTDVAPMQPAGNDASTGPPAPWFWWLVVIFFGLIGGAVAYFVNKDASPAAAKNLLIGGIVSSVIWFFLYYA